MRSLVRFIGAVALVASLAGCGSSVATPTPAPTLPPTPGPTPVPTMGSAGEAYVTGEPGTFSLTDEGTQTMVGAVTQVRGIVATATWTTNDPRANGKATSHLSVDAYGSAGPEWGTIRVENSGGAWEGTLTGASWNDGDSSSLSGWLVGSGSYAGYTFYVRISSGGLASTMEGVIYPGNPPAA